MDLAAGTGLFTRELLGRAARVVAVEPDPRMREVLARRSPEVDAREGWGEAMPLPDASADAVFVSTAWHWLDPERAVPEIARVLPARRAARRHLDEQGPRPGLGGRARPAQAPRHRRRGGTGRAPSRRSGPALDRHHTVTLPDGAEFADQEAASFRFSRTVSIDDALAWLASNSAFITASAADRAAGLARCRDALPSRAGRRNRRVHRDADAVLVLAGAALVIASAFACCERLVITKTVRRRVSGHRKPYHLHVATEYGAYGDQPWRDAEPPYPGQPAAPRRAATGRGRATRASAARAAPACARLPAPPSPPARSRSACIGLVDLAVRGGDGADAADLHGRAAAADHRLGVRPELAGAVGRRRSSPPRSATRRRRARRLRADDDRARGSAWPGRPAARRPPTRRRPRCSPATAARPCCGRPTPTATDSYVVTVGVAVLPSTTQAAARPSELSGAAAAAGSAQRARAVPFKGTPAAAFTDQRRQLSGFVSGPAPTWRSTPSATPTAGRRSRSPGTATPTRR